MQERTSITSYQQAEYFVNEDVSEKIIAYMNNKWNFDNIYILPLLSFRADNYDIVESTCIKLLIDRFDKIVNISSSS